MLISQLFASPFNPGDKKLLAFSDNVQDASHRAGFFEARTFRFNLRTAIQKVVQAADAATFQKFTETSLLSRTAQAKLSISYNVYRIVSTILLYKSKNALWEALYRCGGIS